MSNMRWCNACQDYHWRDDRCYPAWEVWRPETADRGDAMIVRCMTPEAAVRKWATRDDAESAEYQIASGRCAPVICVVRQGSDIIYWYRVRGESVPAYYAEKATPGEKDD